MVASGYRLILLLPATCGPDLPGGPFRLGTPHHACVDTPIPDIHPPGYPRSDILGPTDTQRLSNNNVGEDKGYLGVPTSAEKPCPLRYQDGREAAPYRS